MRFCFLETFYSLVRILNWEPLPRQGTRRRFMPKQFAIAIGCLLAGPRAQLHRRPRLFAQQTHPPRRRPSSRRPPGFCIFPEFPARDGSTSRWCLACAMPGIPARWIYMIGPAPIPGIGSLLAYKHNQAEAQKVADLIVDRLQKQPGLHIILTGHSGGTGVAVWALEKLPADVKVDEVILLASALSPGYDLSPALAHVRGKCYSFCSENDVLVLGAGTKMLGTIDGKKTEAAGQCGFCLPANADVKQYDKLIQKPYDKAWMQYRNFGDHMGCMLREFSQKVIAPLVVPGVPVVVKTEKQGEKMKG